jgi:hypothetical protein
MALARPKRKDNSLPMMLAGMASKEARKLTVIASGKEPP